MVFENVARQSNFTLENQNGKTENFRDVDIEDYLADMFDDPDQFVILTAPQPQHKVRYVQACVQDEGIEVELGIQEEGTRLGIKQGDNCIMPGATWKSRGLAQ